MQRLIVAITGASGAIYGIRALQILRSLGKIETHVILTPAGLRTILEETEFMAEEVRALADRVYDHRDIGAAISSGSFQTMGMLVAPCSVRVERHCPSLRQRAHRARRRRLPEGAPARRLAVP
jgi:4-hydroxy-3-polyprenylbenzoate decarboxylase